MRVDLVGWSLLMIALAMGFSVLHKAGKETNRILKMAGYVIGAIVLITSLVLAVSDLSARAKMGRGGVTGPRRTTTAPTRPATAPKINVPTIPKVPTAPKVETPAIPTPPTP